MINTSSDRIVLPNLNGLRFIAALSVIVFHLFGRRVINGHIGVILFFVLSGFLITFLLLTEIDKTSGIDILKFYLRRILRIWPVYFLVIFLAGIFIGVFHGGQESLNFNTSLPYTILFLPNLYYVSHVAQRPLYSLILWSVGSEEQFYLLWPLLLLIVSRKYLFGMLILIIFFFTATPHLLDYINLHYFGQETRGLKILSDFIQHMCFNAMATGALMAVLFFEKSKFINFLFSLYTQLFSVVSLIVFWVISNYTFKYANDEVYAVFFAILIFNLALNPKSIISFNNYVLEYLGKISYGLYVYHLFVFSLVSLVLYQRPYSLYNGNVIVGFWVIVFSIITSSLSYEFFEKPFLRLKENRFTVVKSGEK